MSENILPLLFDMHRVRKKGPEAVMQRQRTRLAELVDYARTHSPYYRDLYRGLPDRVEEPELLPVTNKRKLMARFNDWVTDSDVTLNKVNAFIKNPNRVGELFLDKYLIGTTSGTTGYRGIFLMDDRARTIYTALGGRRAPAIVKPVDVIKALKGGMRTAMLYVTGGHFVAYAGVVRGIKKSWLLDKVLQIFPVHSPFSELVTQLNHYQPAIVGGYANIIARLASEQEAGRLRINPVQVHLTAEGLNEDGYERIARVFDATVHNWYGCAEFAELTYACEYGRLHVNNDWVILEPVDESYQPVAAGGQSHTVLLSNLANQVQPILRYDLGDSIIEYTDTCPCGNFQPVIRVRGRSSQVLTFPDSKGEEVRIISLVFCSVGDRIPGIELFQVVQTAPANLCVRFRLANGYDTDIVWQSIYDQMTQLLASHELDHVTVVSAKQPPVQTSGGKYPTVIPLN